VEELECRQTPTSIVFQFFPQGPPQTPGGQTADHPAPIPIAEGNFIATVSLGGTTAPIVAPVTIDQQTGAHFSAMINAGAVQVSLKGELNPAMDTVHFTGTIMSNGQTVGTASGDGSFVVDPTCPTCGRDQIDGFSVNFSFTMIDGTTGDGAAMLIFGATGPGT
jgi:hypothetical protein